MNKKIFFFNLLITYASTQCMEKHAKILPEETNSIHLDFKTNQTTQRRPDSLSDSLSEDSLQEKKSCFQSFCNACVACFEHCFEGEFDDCQTEFQFQNKLMVQSLLYKHQDAINAHFEKNKF